MSFIKVEGIDVWIDDKPEDMFRDPLAGDLSEIESYLESSHRFPGVPAKFGPLSIGLTQKNGITQLTYRFSNGAVVEVEVPGVARRIDHKRAFEIDSPQVIETKFRKFEIKKLKAATKIIPANDLQKNLQRTADLKRRVKKLLAN